MYTAIREPDGSLYFALHRSPERLTPAEARAALAALGEILDGVRRRAHYAGSPDEVGRAVPRRRRRGGRTRRRPTPAVTTGEP